MCQLYSGRVTYATSDTFYLYEAPTDNTSDIFRIESETIYYWHVRANSDTLSKTSDWSEYYSFTTGKEQVTLTVTTSDAERGTVTSTPDGIDCGTNCSTSYSIDTSVTLTATAHTGSVFRGWGEDCSGTEETCVVAMDEAKNVSAVFADENAKFFKVWVDTDGDDKYDQGEELKETTVRYRVITEEDNATEDDLQEMMTDEQGVIELSVDNEDTTIYIEKLYGTEAVISDQISDDENPFSVEEVNNIRYEFIMASDIRNDAADDVDGGEYYNFPGKNSSLVNSATDSDGNILIELGHPEIQWNLTVCFEDPYTDKYYSNLKESLIEYADFFYNYTDGYSLIKNIVLIRGGYRENLNIWWRACDIHIRSQGNLRSNVTYIGNSPRYDSYGTLNMLRFNYRPEKWAGILGHESGHYLFGFFDEYKSCSGKGSGNWIYRKNNDGDEGEQKYFPKDYGVMDKDNFSHELSDSSDYCIVEDTDDYTQADFKNRVTEQYCKNQGDTWNTLKKFFAEKINLLGIASTFPDNLIVPPNDVSVTYNGNLSNKRKGPTGMLNNKLNIIDWQVPGTNSDNTSTIGATLKICDTDGLKKKNCTCDTGAAIGSMIYLQTLINDSTARFTLQGTPYKGTLFPIDSFINLESVKQKVWIEDTGKNAWKNYIFNKDDIEEGIVCIDLSDLPDVPSPFEKSTLEGLEENASVSYDSAYSFSSDVTKFQTKSKRGDKEGAIVSIKPGLIGTNQVYLIISARDIFWFDVHDVKATLRGGEVEEFIDFTFHDDFYSGITEYFADEHTGTAVVWVQTASDIISTVAEFEVLNSTKGDTSGFPSLNGKFILSAPEDSFEGSGEFIITNSSITPPSNGKLSQVGNVWSFGFADSITAVYNVSFNILIDGTTQGLDASKLNLYGWNQEDGKWEKISGGSNDLKEFNISLESLTYDSYALFAPTSKDTEAPEPATHFDAQTGTSRWGIDLEWVAPDDNKKVYVYDIRFDTKPITEENWEYSIPIGYWSTPTPGKTGSIEQTFVNMPDPATEYYFAIRSADAAGNWSDLVSLTSPAKSRTPGIIPSEDDEPSISGYVHDKQNNPIEGATVGTQKLGVLATTDSAGYFEIMELEPGNYPLKTEKKGYNFPAYPVKLTETESSVSGIEIICTVCGGGSTGGKKK